MITAYRDTDVPYYKTFSDIEKLLAKHALRGTCVHVPEDRAARTPGAIVILFGRRLVKDGPEIPYRVRMQYRYERGQRGNNTGTTADQVARLALYYLKAKLEMTALGGVPFEEEFLPFQLVSEDTTVFDALAPRLLQLQAAEVPSVFPRALGWHPQGGR